MKVDTETDVLIIGGGPAGLAAGIVCARQGLRTLVYEKRSLPADKACGEGVMPTDVAHLEQLGVKQYFRKGHYFPFKGICYFSSKGNAARASFREGAGWGIPRLELSRALLQRASELDCLEIHTEISATPLRVDKNKTHKRLLVNVGKDHVQTRLVVGADGLNSAVRRWANLQGSKGMQQRWGVRQHFQIAPWSQDVEVHWNEGMEAYVTPCGDDLVGVAFLWDRKRHPHLAGGYQLVPALLEAFPALAERLRTAPASDAPLAVGPMQRNAIQPTANGVVLIGDAAGYLDALTGEGISLALAQAFALGKTVVPILLASGCKDMLSEHDLSAYKQAYQAIVQPYYQMTGLTLWLSQYPALAEQAIRLLGNNPTLFQSLLSANMGLIPFWQAAIGRRR